MPAPIVVDADVLLRNVAYAVRNERPGAILARSSSDYTLTSGVVLFATEQVGREVVRNLPKVAKVVGVPLSEVRQVWNALFVPRVRFVRLGVEAVDDPRIAAVAQLHAPDAPTAALTALLAPAILATDNRKHFRPFGLPDTKTDAVAIDLAKIGEVGERMTAAMLIPTLTGLASSRGRRS